MLRSANGCAYAFVNSHAPSAANASRSRSDRAHMKASFSSRRLGVMSRIISPRCIACVGGSNVTKCSLIGYTSRYCSIRSPMSSDSISTGIPGKGPPKALHDENVSMSRQTSTPSSHPVTVTMPCGPADRTGHSRRYA
jgi:hypothetical protein